MDILTERSCRTLHKSFLYREIYPILTNLYHHNHYSPARFSILVLFLLNREEVLETWTSVLDDREKAILLQAYTYIQNALGELFLPFPGTLTYDSSPEDILDSFAKILRSLVINDEENLGANLEEVKYIIKGFFDAIDRWMRPPYHGPDNVNALADCSSVAMPYDSLADWVEPFRSISRLSTSMPIDTVIDILKTEFVKVALYQTYAWIDYFTPVGSFYKTSSYNDLITLLRSCINENVDEYDFLPMTRESERDMKALIEKAKEILHRIFGKLENSLELTEQEVFICGRCVEIYSRRN